MSILRAIGRALRSAARFLGRALAAPFQWLGGGGGVEEVDVEEETAAVRSSLIDEREEIQNEWLDQARVLTRHAAACVIDGRPVPLPADMSPDVRAFARGLEKDECLAICASTPEAVSSHLQRLFPIPGVQRMQVLEPAEWQRAPSHDYDDALEPVAAYAI